MKLAELVVDGVVDGEVLDHALLTADDADVSEVLELSAHDDPVVRRAVVTVLPLLSGGDPPTPAMVTTCVRLSADLDPSVRDWATFALGTQWRDVDTDEVRDALAARLDDARGETRRESLLGLAYRRDRRAVPRVREALARPTKLWRIELEAAGALSDPGLHAGVLRWTGGQDDPEWDRLGEAVRRLTSPEGPGDDLVAGVADLYRPRSAGDDVALDSWFLMSFMLDIAPYRAREFFGLVHDHLALEPAAQRELREASGLGQLAAESPLT